MISKITPERQGLAKDYLDGLKEHERSVIPSFDELKAKSRKPAGHFCTRCVDQYRKYNEGQRKKDPNWVDKYPNCQGSKETPPVTLEDWKDTNSFSTEEEAEDDYFNLKVTYDPVTWAAAELDVIMEGTRPDPNTGKIRNMDRWYQKEMLRCSSQFKTYRCGRRCIPGDQPILMWDGTVKEMKDVKPGDRVVSMNDVNRLSPGLVTDFYDNGVKPVYEVELNDGRKVRCTSNHPLLAWTHTGENGNSKCQYQKKWKTIEDGLSTDDKAYTLIKYDKFGDQSMPTEAKFLGYFLADGYLGSTGQTPKFTSCTEDYLKEMAQLGKDLFGHECNIRKRAESNASDVYFTDGDKETENKCKSWLNSLGINGPKSKREGVISVVESMDKASLALFINRLWAGDGCVSLWERKGRGHRGKAVELSLTSSDEKLLVGLQRVLYKLGVSSKISEEHRKSPRSENIGCYWKLRVADSTSVRLFLDFTGPIFGKEENSKEALVEIAKRRHVTGKHKGMNFHRVGIKRIEKIGDMPTYDITVDKYHNFTVNGIVTHNTGKSYSMVLETVHYLATNNNVRVLLITPYEKQLAEFFDTMLEMLEGSTTLKNAFKYNKSIHELRFLGNGSVIKSLSTGGDKAGGGDKARGQKADLIVYDEVDYIAQGDIEASIAILLDNPDCKILMSTTPTGKRGFFYNRCTDKSLRYKEFHLYSHASPSVTPIAHEEMMNASSTSAFMREALAEFGDEMVGVFSNSDIDKAVKKYTLQSTRDRGPQPGCYYIVGADWNGRAIGVHITVVEYNTNTQKYRLVDVVRVRNKLYTQDQAVTTIIELYKYWKASWVYVDAGAGDAQIEQLLKHATEVGDEKLAKAIVPVWMQSPTMIRNPLTGEEEKRPTKFYSITLLANRLEKGLLELPQEEEYKLDGDHANDADWGLVTQMRFYYVEKVSVSGVPKYGDTPDHTMVGLYLCILGFQMKMTDLGTVKNDNYVGSLNDTPMTGGIKIEGVQERNRDNINDPDAIIPGQYVQRTMDKNSAQPVYTSSGKAGYGDDVMIDLPNGNIKWMNNQVSKSQRAMQPTHLHIRRNF